MKLSNNEIEGTSERIINFPATFSAGLRAIARPLLLVAATLIISACAVGPIEREPLEPDLDTMLGQMIMVGFRGLEVKGDHPIVREIDGGRVGGVILFDYDEALKSPVRNISSPDQVHKLVASLKVHGALPLIVAVDQEGGRVARLKRKQGFPPMPSARVLGARDDSLYTERVADVTAKMLFDLGINLNLAPVVDLDRNPENPVIGRADRSFSSNAAVVVRQARSFIKAHRERGVRCVLKHFPGHGSSSGDTHNGAVDVTSLWSTEELAPYGALIESGDAEAVMTAHIFNARLDNSFPATLSKQTITGILRERLGFNGVVISDDLQMRAIRDHYGLDEAVEKAIGAGVDILLFGNNSVYEDYIASRVHEIMKKLVGEGKITRQRITESYRRIMKLKDSLRKVESAELLRRFRSGGESPCSAPVA